MKRRVLRQKLFFGSTIEEIDKDLNEFLKTKNICIGNYIDSKLTKLGNIYQLQLIYAKVI